MQRVQEALKKQLLNKYTTLEQELREKVCYRPSLGILHSSTDEWHFFLECVAGSA